MLFPLILIGDLILGGPVSLWPQWHARHVFFFLALISAWAAAWKYMRKKDAWQFAGPILLFLFWNLIWVFVVPILLGNNLQRAWREADALVMLLLAAPLAVLGYRDRLWFKRIRCWVVWPTVCLAIFHIVLWVWGSCSSNHWPVVRSLVHGIYGKPYIFVGPMWGGLFRVFWICSIWLMPAICWTPAVFRSWKLRIPVYAVLLTAMIATYSRGIWLGMILALVVMAVFAKQRRRPWAWRKIGLIAACVFILALVLGGPKALSRFQAGFSSRDEANSQRLAQFEPLLKKWHERPLIGHGYGAGVEDHIRAKEDPFSYEVVPLALLMKLGIIGCAGWAAFLAWLYAECWKNRTAKETIVLAGNITGLFVIACTNPVLMNFVGMGMMCCLMCELGHMTATDQSQAT